MRSDLEVRAAPATASLVQSLLTLTCLLHTYIALVLVSCLSPLFICLSTLCINLLGAEPPLLAAVAAAASTAAAVTEPLRRW